MASELHFLFLFFSFLKLGLVIYISTSKRVKCGNAAFLGLVWFGLGEKAWWGLYGEALAFRYCSLAINIS
jgi:hypothetical protein